jgi:methyl-accepting chemotaxis protein
MHQLSPMGPGIELSDRNRAYTPSWDGIPAVELKSRGVFGKLSLLAHRHSAFAVVFSISIVHLGIGWMAYRLFHLLSPDVQRAFLASADVRWTMLVGALWIVALITVTSAFVLRITHSQINAPITEMARVSEAVANGDLAIAFVPSAATNEVGRLSRATSAIIVALRRLAATMRTSAKDVTALSSQITIASENMAAAAQQTAATSSALSQESKEMAQTIHEIAADAAKLEEVSASLRGRAQEGLRRERRLRSLAQENRARLDESSKGLEALTYDASASAESIEALAS